MTHREDAMKLWPPSLVGVVFCAYVAGSAASLHAQSFTGSLSGTVRDESGGILPHVTVTLVSESTNDVRSQVTASSGNFTFPALPPGTYRLEIEATGFKRYVRSRIAVEVQQQVVMN